jgi:pseudouridine kinase
MTNREQEILNIIKKNPLISQQELADTLGITRSSAAVHITNLIKKGYIIGKGYIVKDQPYVCVIGGTNMDIQGFPTHKLILRDSNPGQVKLSLGGVGRNIAENITRLGIETKLISTIGGDIYGQKILEDAKQLGLDTEHSLILKDQTTSTYLSMLDEAGEMLSAISHMDIMEKMTVDYIMEKKSLIEQATVCVVDTNLPQEILAYLVANIKETPFFLDTVSTAKAHKVKAIIGQFHTIKPNRLEAEILSGMEIRTLRDIENAAAFFISEGVKRVFISLGENGLYYTDGNIKAHLPAHKIKIVNATGAGDAFVAALAYTYFHHFPIHEAAPFAMTAATLALSHENTINPNMSVENIEIKMKELGLC